MPKFLIIRFSSIGDIVLTSPVTRCLSRQVADAEVHFLTKKSFRSVVQHNPYLHKIFYLDNNRQELAEELKKENYDAVIDLHHNLRSGYLIRMLDKPAYKFHKLNIEKWLMVNLKVNWLPELHIVDRYMDTVKHWNVRNDGKGLDYFISPEDEVDIFSLPSGFQGGYVTIAIGALHVTKMIPVQKIVGVIHQLDQPVVLLGGKDDIEKSEEIISLCKGYTVYNATGKYSLNQSASLIKQAKTVITGDTGLMHIAAAYKKKIISVWGNTTPEFGMYPYLPDELKNNSHIIENNALSCRPCSKLGFEKCPKGHFKCMMDLDTGSVIKQINRWNADDADFAD